jgi:hypothetical protein
MTLPKLVSSSPASESAPSDYTPPLSRVFLLSPANTSAIRGQLLLNRNSEFELAQRIRRQGATLAEIFSFISSLYFRGKLAYAAAFSPWTSLWKCPPFQLIRPMLDTGNPFAGTRVPWLGGCQLVPRSFCLAASPAANMLTR